MSARTHPPSVVRRQEEEDLRILLPVFRELNEEQGQLFWLVVSAIRDYRPEGFVALTDEDVAEAASTLAATFETSARGLIYEHRPSSLAAQRLSATIRETLMRLPQASQPSFDRNAAAALRGVEKGSSEARKENAGDATAYLAILDRFVRTTARETASAQPATERASGILMP